MLHKEIIVTSLGALFAALATTAWAQPGQVVSMQEAIQVAVDSNPEIAQAQFNKEAIQFERKQAQGLFLPRVEVETSAGIRKHYAAYPRHRRPGTLSARGAGQGRMDRF
jgi:outer membrane protein, adhesin transport system